MNTAKLWVFILRLAALIVLIAPTACSGDSRNSQPSTPGSTSDKAKTVSAVRPVRETEPKKQGTKCKIDKINGKPLDSPVVTGEMTLTVAGWATNNGAPAEMEVYLESAEGRLKVPMPIKRTRRLDVSRAFSLDVENVGFYSQARTNEIPPGKYVLHVRLLDTVCTAEVELRSNV